MALSASTVLEIRNGGNDTNSGGFVTGASGTDWSLQDTAQYSVTDGVAAGTTTLTSVTAAFGTDVVGNLIYVSGGTGSITAGWYQIISRTNSTTIVVDRSTGLTAGTGVTLKIGGALASPGQAGGIMTVEGMIAYLKYNASAYVVSSTTANVATGKFAPTGGGYTLYSGLIGYDTTRTVNNTDANKPTIQVASSGVTSINVVSTASAGSGFAAFVIRNVIVDGQSKSTITGFSGGANSNVGIFVRCKAINCTASGFTGGYAFFCEATTCSTVAAFNATGCLGCWAYGNTIQGFLACPTAFCISSNNTGAGFNIGFTGNNTVNCLAYQNTGPGFTCSFQRTGAYVNCLAVLNGTYGFNLADGQTCPILVNCAAKSNTSGDTTGIRLSAVQSINFIGNASFSGDPFTNAAGNDFTLNNTTGAGAILRAAGFPGSFPTGSTGYGDINVFQHQDSGGSGPAAVQKIIQNIGTY